MSALPVFEKIRNFRDCGGYVTQTGRSIATRRLFRSAHHTRATDSDLEGLAELDLAAIVDLRMVGERATSPSRRAPNFGGRVIEHERDRTNGLPPHLAAMHDGTADAETTAVWMAEIYRGIPFDPANTDIFRRFFKCLAAGDGPVLVHCAGGKDRTGFLVALTHHMLGVAREDIAENFLATNEDVWRDELVCEIMHNALAKAGKPVSFEAVKKSLLVEMSFLDAAFDAITQRCGSLDRYLEDEIGVDRQMRIAVERCLLI